MVFAVNDILTFHAEEKAFKMALNLEAQYLDTGQKNDADASDLRDTNGSDGLKKSGIVAAEEEW